MVFLILSCVIGLVTLLFSILRFLNKVWFIPNRIQRAMIAQGIKGPSYKFLFGNVKEIMKMIKKTRSNSMELSHDIVHKVQPHIHTWAKLYGDTFMIWLGPRPQLVITNPELVKEILADKDEFYPRMKFPKYLKKVAGSGIFASEGEKWKKLRRVANHAFYAESLKNMYPAMITSVEEMLERLRRHQNKEINAYEEFKIMNSDIISRTAFGSNYKDGEKIFGMMKKMGELLSQKKFQVQIPLIGNFVKSKGDVEMEKLNQSIKEYVTSIIKEREEEMRKDYDDMYASDYLGLLIKASNHPEEKNRVTKQEIIDECKTFYNSGQETSTGFISWATLLLAIHTDWQEKARAEVFQVFGQETPTREGIGKLPIMNMIINETLRLYSPVIQFMRTTKREVKLGKYILPHDMDLFIPNLVLRLDPNIWGDDVHLFKPDRFANGISEATNGKIAAFIPFGFGPKICVGMNFANTGAKIALTMILQRYKFTLSPSYVHSPVKFLTVQPQFGVPIVLHPIIT